MPCSKRGRESLTSGSQCEIGHFGKMMFLVYARLYLPSGESTCWRLWFSSATSNERRVHGQSWEVIADDLQRWFRMIYTALPVMWQIQYINIYIYIYPTIRLSQNHHQLGARNHSRLRLGPGTQVGDSGDSGDTQCLGGKASKYDDLTSRKLVDFTG